MPGNRIPPTLCTRCKGYKRLCGLHICPILAKFRSQVLGANRVSSREVEGSTPPSILVGEKNYPRVPVILYTPPGIHGEAARRYDDPENWHASRTPLAKIIEYRSYLVGGIMRIHVKSPWRLYEQEVAPAATSTRPVETETLLARKPEPILRFDGLLAPHGPSAPANRVRVAGDPKPPRKLEKLVWDDAPAAEATIELYRSGVDYYTILTAFSLGMLGRLRNRRLVPTRWAITAVDDIVGDWLLEHVKRYKPLDKYKVYRASYLGNTFTILLAPGAYRAEMIEIWYPLTPWTPTASRPTIVYIDEDNRGRVTPLDGGYMAARLPVLEKLYSEQRQATVLIVREVTRDYYAPVGNWHIRETVREALSRQPVAEAQSLEEAITALLRHTKDKYWASRALASSRLLKLLRTQTSLDAFLASGD